MKSSTIIALASLFILASCTHKTNQPKEEALWDETNSKVEHASTTISENTVLEGDTTIYGWKELMEGKIKETPILGVNPKEYFRENNKFKDWDATNPKQVFLEYVVEKDGTASNIKIKESSGNSELDNEAVRLIKEAAHLPGTNHKGEPIRCGNSMIYVYFPPK